MLPQFKFALREDLKDKKEFLPTRGEPKATGWDVRSSDDLIIKPFEYVKIRLGFRALCPDGWWFEMRPRSSTYTKKNMHALYGVVDETYEGEAIFAAQYIPFVEIETSVRFSSGKSWGPEEEDYYYASSKFIAEPLKINFGDAVGQMIPVQRQEIEVISLTNEEIEAEYKSRNATRGAGGFGSTGR